jgi:hypothetical protein
VPDLFYRAGEKLSFDLSQMSDEKFRERLMRIVSSVRPEMVVADTEAISAAIGDDPSGGLRAEGLRRLMHGRPAGRLGGNVGELRYMK